MLASTIYNAALLFASLALALPKPSFGEDMNDIAARGPPPSRKEIIKRKPHPHLGDDDINIRSTAPEPNIRGEIAMGSRNAEIVKPGL